MAQQSLMQKLAEQGANFRPPSGFNMTMPEEEEAPTQGPQMTPEQQQAMNLQAFQSRRAENPAPYAEQPRQFTPSGGAGFIPQADVPMPPDATGSMSDLVKPLQLVADALFSGQVQLGSQTQPAEAPTSMGGQADVPAGLEGGLSAQAFGPVADERLQAPSLADMRQGAGGLAQGILAAREQMGAGQPQSLSGVPLSEYLQGGTQLDEQGRMIDPTSSRASFEIESQKLQDRINQSQNFGQTVSDRERRGTGEMSMAEATRMAGGDRTKARQMIEMQRQGMGQFAEDSNQRTPEQVENERLQNKRLEQIIQKGNQPDATKFQKQRAEFEERMQALQETDDLEPWEVSAMRNDFLGRPAPQGYKSWAEYESLKRGEETPTGGEGESTAETQDGGSTPPASTVLDKAMAADILKEAGGDKNKAREIAKERGYKL